MESKNIFDYVKLYQNLKDAKIKGIGEKGIEKFRELKIKSVMDLLFYFPRDYEDRNNIKMIKDVIDNEFVVIKGRVLKAGLQKYQNGKVLFKIVVSDETGLFEAVWFQMPYLAKVIFAGMNIILTGKVKNEFGLKMANPDYKIIEEGEIIKGEIVPIYGLIHGLNQSSIRKAIYNAILLYGEYLFEVIPVEIIKKYKIVDRLKAMRSIHFPKFQKDIEDAKRRFAIEELLVLEIGILSRRFELDRKIGKRYELEDKKEKAKNFLQKLGFELTSAQKKVITEIYRDINNGKIVNRLIQGDVGSGKTAVAIIMLIYMAENGYQGALMAPTEILAEQHYLGMVEMLNSIGVRIKLLTSAIKGKRKEAILQELINGDIDILIGTHSLIEEDVKFNKLGLIVIDEQHKFGVLQRKELRDKGILANLIVMSATPIPRSLALSIYGDLDVSIIDQLPPGRKPIKTKWIKDKREIESIYYFISKKIDEGKQCYFVCPLIEESEKMELKSVEELYDELKEDIFPTHKLEILHGRMKSEEKEAVMKRFKENDIQILVATMVIEVGVNVPNASVMVIVDAHRFGLAQLHQLRGRVGRGVDESFCFLVAYTDNELSKARLRIMERTTDGFEIAEEDLKLRKPGEVFGTRQSGIGDLKFTDLVNDVKTIKLARDEAMEFLTNHNGVIENSALREDIKRKLSFDWVSN